MNIEMTGRGERESYRLLTSVVVPRSIAWVSTVSPDGRLNLAPFSYFQAVCDAFQSFESAA